MRGARWRPGRRGRHLLAIGLVVVCFSAPAATAAQAVVNADTVIAAGLERPVYVTHAGDGSGRLFVIEQLGRIRVIDDGVLLATPFLDIGALVSGPGERGLLSVAFHPQYAVNGLFYVNYTDTAGDTVIASYTVSGDPNVADPNSATILLTVAQPATNHNGGQLHFSPDDGFLYIGMGDGGLGGHGQNTSTLLGAMLRIDVDGGTPYAVPASNPFVGGAGADEIWAYGLRNPWRFSFDRDNGDLYLGDVGQATWEEIDFLPAGGAGGANFGWMTREGPCPLGETLPCAAAPAGFTDPIAYYGRTEGRSVTGGYVYRGTQYPTLAGRYYYADFITGNMWSIIEDPSSPGSFSTPLFEGPAGFFVSSFGEDEDGELYLADYHGGTIRRMTVLDPPSIASPSPGGTLSASSVSFSWGAGATTVTDWWIYAGSSVGGSDYFDSGPLGSATTTQISGLPTDGSTVHVRLWFEVFGQWRFVDSTYTAVTPPPAAAPVSPIGVPVDSTPTFDWNAAAGATWYYLWVEGTGGVVSLRQWYRADQIGCAGGGACTVTPSVALDEGNNTWWVRSWGGGGQGPWSAAAGFTVSGAGARPPRATLLAPIGAITNPTPTYRWNAVPGSTWYYLWVRGPAGTPVIRRWYTAAQAGCQSGVGICSVTPPTALPNGTNTWWIQTWNPAGTGLWSSAATIQAQ